MGQVWGVGESGPDFKRGRDEEFFHLSSSSLSSALSLPLFLSVGSGQLAGPTGGASRPRRRSPWLGRGE